MLNKTPNIILVSLFIFSTLFNFSVYASDDEYTYEYEHSSNASRSSSNFADFEFTHYNELAAAEYRSGNLEGAIKICEIILSSDDISGKDKSYTHANLALIYLEQKDLPRAYRSYQAALKLIPDTDENSDEYRLNMLAIAREFVTKTLLKSQNCKICINSNLQHR